MNDTRQKAIEAMREARVFKVVVKPATFPADDTYHIMIWPECIVQIGGDYTDHEVADAACLELNEEAALDAALGVMMQPDEAMVKAGREAFGDTFGECPFDESEDERCFKRIWTKTLNEMKGNSNE